MSRLAGLDRGGPEHPAAGLPPDAEALVELPGPLELAATLAPLAHGTGDPTIRFTAAGVWRATRLAEGAVTLHLRQVTVSTVQVRAWGPGATEGIARAGELLGALDQPSALRPMHPALRRIVRHHPGIRLVRSRRVMDALLPAILEQKVTGIEARRSFRAIIRRHGQPAPGPGGLWLPPAPEVLAALPSWAFHSFGVERRRAETIRRAARIARRLETAPTPEATDRLLRAIPGIGPWTAAEVLRVTWGAPDAISMGDYHLPNLVAWSLAGEARADDERMLELLTPYVGQRGRVQRLLEAAGPRIPRFGPRMAPRSIAAI